MIIIICYLFIDELYYEPNTSALNTNTKFKFCQKNFLHLEIPVGISHLAAQHNNLFQKSAILFLLNRFKKIRFNTLETGSLKYLVLQQEINPK